MPYTRPHSTEPQKDGLPSSDFEPIDLPLFCPGEKEVSVVSEMTSAPYKDKGGHLLTAHWDRTAHHRGRHKHSSTARHRWELAVIGSHGEEARRPDQIPRERQRRVSV